MSRSRSLTLAAALGVAIAAAGCGGGSSGESCSVRAEKANVLAATDAWYLYPELLPVPRPDPEAFASAAALLDALTQGARAQVPSRDRGWSFLTTGRQTQEFFGEGVTVGYGLGLLVRGDAPARLLVREAIAGGAAAQAGFRRGDEILQVGPTESTLLDVGPLLAEGASPSLAEVLASSQAGTTRTFRVLPQGAAPGAPTVLRTVTTRLYGLDPVPVIGAGGGTTRWRILEPETTGGTRVGYVMLRTFIEPADALLRQAFDAFRAAGVTDLVLDLRYNGGGLVSTAELLANLLGGGRTTSDEMFRYVFSPSRPAGATVPGVQRFTPQPQSIAARRIVFVVTSASASASELVPNVLAPYADVRIVGARSNGKPVGQSPFDLRTCDSVLFLVTFKLLNSEGDGEYFGGLPYAGASGREVGGTLCERPDDLDALPGDTEEEMTRAAVAVAATGACPEPAPAAALAKAAAPAQALRPAVAAAPTLAQQHLPGLF